jgi:uncharacterized protein
MLLLEDARNLRPLTEADCLRLVGKGGIGRLGCTDQALPAVWPVSFSVHDGVVVMPARPGSSVLAAVTGSVVVVQVDSWGQTGMAGHGDGWSVSLIGLASVVRPAGSDAVQVCALHLRPGITRGWRWAAPSDGQPSSG